MWFAAPMSKFIRSLLTSKDGRDVLERALHSESRTFIWNGTTYRLVSAAHPIRKGDK